MITGYSVQVVDFFYITGFMITVIKVYFILHVTICVSNVMNHCSFCDISLVLELACKDMSIAQQVDFALAIVTFAFPFIITILSHIYIISDILHISSTQGGKKSSTWAPHLTVVIVYCIAMIVVYVQSRTIASFNSNKIISAVYAVLTHMLNPFIYSLRTREVKNAIKKTMGVGQCLLLSWALLPCGRNSVRERMSFLWHLSWFCIFACFIDLDF